MNPNFNFSFSEFLKSLAGMNRDEIIHAASRESNEAKSFSVKRGGKYATLRLNQQNYISDLGDFLYFVRNTPHSEVPYPEAFLNSDEYKHTMHFRTFGV
jgi:hypothetical protein